MPEYLLSTYYIPTMLLSTPHASSSLYLTSPSIFLYLLYVGVLSCFSHVQLFATSWTIARQAPLSLGFSRQEYWSRLPYPPLGDLLDPGIESTPPVSPTLQADSLPAEPLGKPNLIYYRIVYISGLP